MAATSAPAAMADNHEGDDVVVVAENDFSGDSIAPFRESGSGVQTTIVDFEGDRVLQVGNRSNDFYGIETPPGLLQAGVEYTITAQIRLAAGGPASTGARFVGTNGQNIYDWIGNRTINATEWTTITGSWVAVDNPRIFIGTSNVADYPTYSYLVDDIVITRAAEGPGNGQPGGTVVLESDFEDGLQGWTARADGAGPATVSVTDAEAHTGEQAALVSGRTSQGQGIGYDVTEIFESGTSYDIEAYVKFAEGSGPGNIWLSIQIDSGGSTSYNTVAQFANVTGTDWYHVTAPYSAGSFDRAYLYFETNYPDGIQDDFLLDDVTIAVQAPAVIQDLTPIQDTFDIPVGVAIDQRETVGGASELLLRHFNQVTAENYMKPQYFYDADRQFRIHPEATILMDFAAENDLDVYGHVLVWHSQSPDWFFQDEDGVPLTTSEEDRQFLRDRMRTHIFDVAESLSTGGGYGLFGSEENPVTSFDVVNEVVHDGGEYEDGLRRSEWYRILGEEYIALAFEYAEEAFNEEFAAEGADRPVALFINDYNTEQGGKQNRYFDLVERLVEADVPIDGVGHQFHVSLSMPISALEGALERFTAFEGLTQAVTELDVTIGTTLTEALLIDQGYYYRDAFRVFRDYEDELFSVTVWGLTDNRSWRAAQYPLLFDAQLQAKHAYYGAVDEDLPPRVRSAPVFRTDVPFSEAGLTSPVWDRLPLHEVDDVARFQLRWAPDHLSVYLEVDDVANDTVVIQLGEQIYEVSGTGDGDVDAVVALADGGWTALVRLPLDDAGLNDVLELDVRVGDAGWNAPGVLGGVTLVEQLSFVEVAFADEAPEIDGEVDGVWEDAATVTTAKVIQGSADGATAEVRTLWEGSTLYVLAEVTDAQIDTSGSDPWVQDSVEIFLDAGNFRAGSYRYDDTQIRINANNDVSFGTGDEAYQAARVESATAVVDGGYVVEAAISLLEYGGEGTFHGLDFQVNDGTDGVRTAIKAWADPTGLGYQSTARWGVAELLPPGQAPSEPEPTDPDPTDPTDPDPTDPGPGPSFSDVRPGHPFYDDIRWMADTGLSAGYSDGTFRPSTRLSRQAMAAFIHRYAGDADWAPAAGTQTFSDVPVSHPFHTEIEWLAQAGLAEGYPDGTFQPSRRMSRQAMAAFMYRLSEVEGYVPTGSPAFTDVPRSHPFFREIQWMFDTELSTGYQGGTFLPDRGISRQATAAFLHRYDTWANA